METAHGLVNSRNKHQQSIWLARKTQKTKQYFTNLKWRFFAGCSWFPMVSPPSQSIPKTNGEAPQVHLWTAPAMNSLPPAGLDGTVGISLENVLQWDLYGSIVYNNFFPSSRNHLMGFWIDPTVASRSFPCQGLLYLAWDLESFFDVLYDGWMDR